MNSKNKSPVGLKGAGSAMIVSAIASAVMVLNPMSFWLSALVLPVFLLFVLGSLGVTGFLLTLGAGLVPLLILGQGFSALIMTLPALLVTGGLFLMIRGKTGYPPALAVVALAQLLGLVLAVYASLYLIGGSDYGRFTAQIADSMKNSLLAVSGNMSYELPPSQLQLLQQAAEGFTAEYIQDLLPGVVLSWALLAGYFVLRLAQRFLNGSFRVPLVPVIGRVHINPFVLVSFMLLFGAGRLADLRSMRMGSLLINTGYTVTMFLGIVGGLSLIYNFCEKYLKIRNPVIRGLITLAIVMTTSGTLLTLLTIADSILDFRNTSGRSLYRWLIYRLSQNDKEE